MLAVLSLVCSVLWLFGVGSLLGIVFGVIARKQIKHTHQPGSDMALAGIVAGAIALFFTVLIGGLSYLANHTG